MEEASEASERASTPPPASTEPESVSAASMVAEMALVMDRFSSVWFIAIFG